MLLRVARVTILSAACLLAGCASQQTSGLLGGPENDHTAATAADPATTGSVASLVPPDVPTAPGLLGTDPNDDLALGKKHYHAKNYGLAERHFRRAVEAHPKDGESWLGLAAAYDRLRRYDLADRAYTQLLQILGPTPEVLNNQAYSYMLRGDHRRAREKLLAARSADPENPHVNANLKLLAASMRKGKAVE
jgi:tetratricopeptide (TPR) repeat protein